MTWVEQYTVLIAVVVLTIGLVSAFSGRLGVAAPLLLVVVGAGLSLLPGAEPLHVEPHLILGVVLPPLLYGTALKMAFVEFRRNLKAIVSLAVVLVALSALAAALFVQWAYPATTFALALALGAVVAPPDAVAAISLGRRLGLPPRVVSIMEGEGLVNDATALVLLSTALSVATGADGGGTDAWDVVGSFVWAVVGAVVIGALVGFVVVAARSRITDPVLDVTIALVVPFLTFLIAEEAHASGVVAVVVAGLWVGERGLSRIEPGSRRAEAGNWATFLMLMENGVFLFLGYQLIDVAARLRDVDELQGALWAGVGLALVLVLVRVLYMPLVIMEMRASARRAAHRHARRSAEVEHMKGPGARPGSSARRRLSWLRRRLERQGHDLTAERNTRLGWRDATVLSLAGMRGVVTIAAAQTLPADHPMYDTLVLLAFVVALATLLPQGFLLPFVVRGLRLQSDDDSEARLEYVDLLRRMGQAGEDAGRATLDHLDADAHLREGFEARHEERRRQVEAQGRWERDDDVDLVTQIRRAELNAERTALREERRRGEFSSEALAQAQRFVDDDMMQLDLLAREASVR